MSEEEKKSFEELKKEINKPLEVPEDKCNTFILYNIDNAKIIVNLTEKQQKKIQKLQTIDKEHQKLNGELRDEIKRQGNTREIEEKDIEKIIEYIKKEYGNFDNYVRDLLDLYQKEKEKREIAEENHKVLSLDIAQACKELGLYEDTIIADELVVEINKKFISKDKIREKIKEYKGLKEIDKMAYEEQIKPLQELLEEE